jgi:hypothetical protein
MLSLFRVITISNPKVLLLAYDLAHLTTFTLLPLRVLLNASGPKRTHALTYRSCRLFPEFISMLATIGLRL